MKIRQDFFKDFRFAADHERELSFFQSNRTAGHRRIEHLGAGGFNLLGDFADGGRAHRAHFDVDFSRAQSGQNSLFALGDGAQRAIIGDHGKYRFGRFYCSARTVGPLHSGVEEPLRLGLGPVVTRDAVAGIEQPFRHAAAHYSQTDKTEIRHGNSKKTKYLRLSASVRTDRLTFRLDIFAHFTQRLGRLIEQRGKIFEHLFGRDVRKIDFGLFRFG